MDEAVKSRWHEERLQTYLCVREIVRSSVTGEGTCRYGSGATKSSRRFRLLFGPALFALAVATPQLHAQDEDFDSYKLRIDAFWFHANPSGSLQSAGQYGFGVVDIDKDMGLDSFSTFSGKVDWKFTRKNHLYFAVSPFNRSRESVLNRTVVFQGQTFDAGLVTQGDLRAHLYAPGYQYDIIRRKRGHLGIAFQIDLFDTEANISAAAQVTPGGVQQAARSASGSLLAPIPVAGPQFRAYLTNSPRLFVDGNVYGMYLFGYGNFVSSSGTLGLTLSKNLSVNAGYQLGSRLEVKSNASDRIGIRLTQMGAIAGLQLSF